MTVIIDSSILEYDLIIITTPYKTHLNILNKIYQTDYNNIIFCEKVTSGIAVGIIDLGPKVIQNGIQKSWKFQHRKSMLKWCPKGRKGVENIANMAPKIETNPYNFDVGNW